MELELRGYRDQKIVPREDIRQQIYSPNCIDQMLKWSGQGQLVDEWLATWCIDRKTWDQWLTDHQDLADLVGIANARARGSLLGELRRALQSRSAFPVALAERLLKHVEAEGSMTLNAADLVTVHTLPQR